MTGNAGTLASGISYGWIFEDTKCGFASEIYASTIKNYAHELKNSATYNLLSGLIAQGSGWAVGYGQDTGTGPSKNVLVGLVSAGCDGGFTAGYGAHNLVVGMLHDNTGAPNISGTSHLARFESTNYNAIFGALGIGSYVSTVHHAGNGNYVQVASHDTTSTVVRLLAGVSKNCTEIAHPGARTSILAAINDASGNSMRGSSANPVWCNATGERVGSISGLFRDRLGVSGAILNANHYWIKESDQYAINVFQTPGNSGDNAGIAYGTPASGTQGLFIYSKGSSDANDYWFIRVGNANTYRFYSTVFRPETNDAVDLGNASSRWKNLFLSGHISRAVGANVASATTITPSGPIFHVTGVTAIATINLPYTGFTGSIKIIPDGIFTTTTAGNIGLASTAVVGKVLEMTYDGTKWWPSY